jgi:hypothetical protein
MLRRIGLFWIPKVALRKRGLLVWQAGRFFARQFERCLHNRFPVDFAPLASRTEGFRRMGLQPKKSVGFSTPKEEATKNLCYLFIRSA